MSKVTSPPISLKSLGLDTDDIANETGWTPLLKDAASFRISTLEQVNPKHVRFAPTLGFLSFSLLFLCLGPGVLVLYFTKVSELIIVPILGSIFSLVGVSLVFFTKNYISIRNIDGKWKLTKRSMLIPSAYLRPFSQMYALQLLKKSVTGSADSYTAYELNIVYDDGARENILNQANHEATLRDAVDLSKMLAIPLWNGVVTSAAR